jgi:isoleucyl-tRNA synthetase
MIRPASKVYDPVANERMIREWWERENIYEKVKKLQEGKSCWTFLDGPPYASGAIHLGTAWNKIIKDVVLRYKTMRGFDVTRKPGWDCHGLPIEVKVEEKLGIKSKKEIESRVGVTEFIERCKEWATDHIGLMTKQFKELGVWMDWDDPYITFRNEYIEAAWWTLKRAYEKDLLKRDLRVIHWCPRCETALAEHEVRGEYREVSDPSVYVKFKLREKPNEYLLIWTTTPWTLPADLAVCVHPDFEYARVLVGDAIYILARGLLQRVFSELGIRQYQILEVSKGKELEGISYEHPLLDEVPAQREFQNHHRVICGSHVTLEEGTGCVHTAPGHGEEDFEVGERYELPVFSPVGPDGRFTSEAGKYVGLYVKEADSSILEDLERKGLLVKRGEVLHSYPHCWRCQTPLVFRATEQWFLSVKELKPRILERNSKEVKWTPEWAGVRYINGVESVGDWCISRQRYWGIPLPIWVCSDCGELVVVGGIEELRRLARHELGDLDLHKPDVDRVELRCACGGAARRVPDILDVWFDSGVASWASLGYPRVELGGWPFDFITEGEDQITKWFYSQQVLSVVAFDRAPYKSVLMHGFALDEKGRKMSKSLGNVVEPWEVAERYGADVLRFYMLSANPLWEDLKFSWKGVELTYKLLNVLWNVHVFATTYMALDNFNPSSADVEKIQEGLMPEDRWLISRVNTLVAEVSRAMERYEFHRATRKLSDFIFEDLSRWYIRLVRGRAWIEREDPRKLAAYATLYQSMHVLIRLLAPLMPHLTEVLYRELVKAVSPEAPESVHMLPWPTPEQTLIDRELEEGMAAVRKFVEGAARLRQEAGLKLRWPVRRVAIRSDKKRVLVKLRELFRNQLNCKELEIFDADEPFILPPDGTYVKGEVEAGEIVMDVRMTPELRAECMAREVVRRLQLMRKEMDLGMEELVDATIGLADAGDLRLLASQQAYISREVRVRNLRLCTLEEVSGEGYLKEWNIDEKRFKLLLARVG